MAVQEPVSAPVSAEEVSRVLREILAGAEFHVWNESLMSRILGWVADKLGELWRWLIGFGDTVGGGWVGAILFFTVLLALVWLSVRWSALPVVRAKVRQRQEMAPEPRTAADWFGVATSWAAQGLYRPAATALYRGFLLRLDGAGVVNFHTSKTPGEYAREARRQDAGVSVGRFFGRFQEISFGHDEPTEAHYNRLEDLTQSLGADTAGDEVRRAPRPTVKLLAESATPAQADSLLKVHQPPESAVAEEDVAGAATDDGQHTRAPGKSQSVGADTTEGDAHLAPARGLLASQPAGTPAQADSLPFHSTHDPGPQSSEADPPETDGENER